MALEHYEIEGWYGKTFPAAFGDAARRE